MTLNMMGAFCTWMSLYFCVEISDVSVKLRSVSKDSSLSSDSIKDRVTSKTTPSRKFIVDPKGKMRYYRT